MSNAIYEINLYFKNCCLFEIQTVFLQFDKFGNSTTGHCNKYSQCMTLADAD